MGNAPTIRRLIADAATWIALAPATLIFMGWSKIRAYHQRLGLYDLDAMPSAPALMVEGLRLLRDPALAVAFTYVLSWVILSVRRKQWAAPLEFSQIPLLAWMTGGMAAASVISSFDFADSTPVLLGSFTVLDFLGVVLVLYICGFLAILASSFVKAHLLEVMYGNTLSGTILLAVALLATASIHADNVGWELGNDRSLACVEYPAVRLWSQELNLTGNTTYLFVAHNHGTYYLRNLDLPSSRYGVFAVKESMISYVLFSKEPPMREKCDD